ncbi:MAG: flagellar biosynthesis protein FlhF [Thermoguttaceae bacterium]|jgi:flagellar biosynthesis protein FlhF|nr:flagellar biosynthesis protein FlhF [Thermoguttaceae bacterium]
MDIRTYRAATMYDALAMVRRELGPDAAVLHTREVRAGGLFGWLRRARQIEVTASAGVNVPSRLPPRAEAEPVPPPEPDPIVPPRRTPAAPLPSAVFSDEVKGRLSDLQAMVQELCRQSRKGGPRDLPETLFRLFTDLIEADLDEDAARDLIERVRSAASDAELADPVLVKARVARMLESEIVTLGPISVVPGRRRLVAMVGPTGVGKTTTIAKLAAIYRLKQKRKVGLITVDTYRIAAVEQLRTYADIIDLPMQVVSTPREMREAARKMDDLDLVLLDTAGRSPKDGIKIQELKAFLTEAAADEVYLVLSAVAGAKTLAQTAQRFAAVGTSGLILTKLDEATGLGHLLPLLRASRLPLAYLTNGQNVPDDIEVAQPGRLARLILGMEAATT